MSSVSLYCPASQAADSRPHVTIRLQRVATRASTKPSCFASRGSTTTVVVKDSSSPGRWLCHPQPALPRGSRCTETQKEEASVPPRCHQPGRPSESRAHTPGHAVRACVLRRGCVAFRSGAVSNQIYVDEDTTAWAVIQDSRLP